MNLLLVLFSLALFPTTAHAAETPSSEEIVLLETRGQCSDNLVKGPIRRGKISAAAFPAGLAVGVASDLVLTLTSGGVRMIPSALGKWMPFLNETATVLSKATGKKWIYDGLSRRIIDGVAIGALGGLAIRAGDEHGTMVGLLNFMNGVGLTYWLPSTYFKQWMENIPNSLPKALRKPAKKPVGQLVIGASMIVILEQILEYTNHLIEKLPKLFAEARPSGSFPVRRIAAVTGEKKPISLDHAVALFLLDGALEDLEDAKQESALLYLAGGPNVALTPAEKDKIRSPLQKIQDKPYFRDLFSKSELGFLKSRADRLLAN